jgi:DNA-binding GntR family transcriptional regulator
VGQGCHDLPVDIDPLGEVPVYQQLAGILRTQIESGELPPGRSIPSKRDLRERYGVSGGTVDKAVGLLKDEGLVRGVHGKGLFVIRRDG